MREKVEELGFTDPEVLRRRAADCLSADGEEQVPWPTQIKMHHCRRGGRKGKNTWNGIGPGPHLLVIRPARDNIGRESRPRRFTDIREEHWFCENYQRFVK